MKKIILILIKLILIISIDAYGNQFTNNWTPLYKGIDYKLLVKNKGKIRAHLLKIDATNPDIDAFVTPPKKGKTKTSASKPSTFLKKHKAQVVINALGYTPLELSPEGTDKSPQGLSIYQGQTYSESKEENAAFIVLKDGTKKIIKTEELPLYQSQISMAVGAWPWAGVGGLLIEDGVSLVPEIVLEDEKFARSALGISKDGNTIYLVVVEGKPRIDFSTIYDSLVGQGILLKDLASLLQDLGCDRAINLDGSGSSTLAVENIITNQPLVLNIPSDHKGERAVGSHLAFKAPYIEGQEQLITFRKLQESTAFFDLLQKNPSRFCEIYQDSITLDKLGIENMKSLNELYQDFGIAGYNDHTRDYNSILKSKGYEYEECFLQNNDLNFQCGNPKDFAKALGFKSSNHIKYLSDLKFVGKKKAGVNKGGTYMDSNKVFYFVKEAQSVANEFIGSRLMNLILGTEYSPVTYLLKDHPKMVASRMIRGFIMKNDFQTQKLPSTINDEGALDIASSFIALVDRHKWNTGYVEKDSQNVFGARIDYDHSFEFNTIPIGGWYTYGENGPNNLMQLHYALRDHKLESIKPTLERIINIPDEQITMLIFECWLALSQIKHPLTLQDAFKIASQLIDRKKAFKTAFEEIDSLSERIKQNPEQFFPNKDKSYSAEDDFNFNNISYSNGTDINRFLVMLYNS